jgi:hypothetical protein
MEDISRAIEDLSKASADTAASNQVLEGASVHIVALTQRMDTLAATHDAGVTLSSKEQHVSPRFRGAIVRHCGLYKSMT